MTAITQRVAADLDVSAPRPASVAPTPEPHLKRVLMVAYHFPPLAGSSGIQRTLRFVQHLPGCGWQPLVLTASTRAYERTSDDLNTAIAPDTVVRRAFALDAARHLAVQGHYLQALALPDRWSTWRFDAVRQGMRMIRDFRPDAIWSTYPVATAHVIGAELQRRSGLPWLADFRDPMAQNGYPTDPRTWRAFEAIERTAAERARWCMFTTSSATRTYQARYPFAAERMVTLENGYDEESFASAEAALHDRPPLNPGSTTLLHSGIVYPDERDPTQLFVALARLREQGALPPGRLKLRFRAAVHDDLLRSLAEQYGVPDVVEVCAAVPYREALQEMLRADALLVLQAANCNEQVPAKIYEYLRARRPIVCLSHPEGDTCDVLRRAGVDEGARLDDAEGTAVLLRRLLDDACAFRTAGAAAVAAASREGRTAQLSSWLASA